MPDLEQLIRDYAEDHPHATIQTVADELGVSVDAVVLAFAGPGAIVTGTEETATIIEIEVRLAA